MTYKLTIIKYDRNPYYEEELEKEKQYKSNYGYSNELIREKPEREIETRSLEVLLTEEEYKKIKHGVIELFE